jgi:hypothetical protein
LQRSDTCKHRRQHSRIQQQLEWNIEDLLPVKNVLAGVGPDFYVRSILAVDIKRDSQLRAASRQRRQSGLRTGRHSRSLIPP